MRIDKSCFLHIPPGREPEKWVNVAAIAEIELVPLEDALLDCERGCEKISSNICDDICQAPIVNVSWISGDFFTTYYGVQGQAILDALSEAAPKATAELIPGKRNAESS